LINLAELGTKAARCCPRAPALIDAQRGNARTFAELSGRVQCLAVSLRNMFGPGQRVAVLSRNCFEMVELYLACAAGGSLLFPMNWELSAAQLKSTLLEADPVAIFYDKTYQSIIDQLHSVVDARNMGLLEPGRESGCEELLVPRRGRRRRSWRRTGPRFRIPVRGRIPATPPVPCGIHRRDHDHPEKRCA